MRKRFRTMGRQFRTMGRRFVCMRRRFWTMRGRFVSMGRRFRIMGRRFVKLEATEWRTIGSRMGLAGGVLGREAGSTKKMKPLTGTNPNPCSRSAGVPPAHAIGRPGAGGESIVFMTPCTVHRRPPAKRTLTLNARPERAGRPRSNWLVPADGRTRPDSSIGGGGDWFS